MKRVLLGLILLLTTSGFVIAGPTSDVRTDFYISALSIDSPEQNFFSNFLNLKSPIVSGIAALITLIIIVVILRKILKNKKKIQKTKKARRKK